jgi:phage-related tail fiber protein
MFFQTKATQPLDKKKKKKKKKPAHGNPTFTSPADLAKIEAVTSSAERSENVITPSQTPLLSSKAGLSPESSTSPRAFASQGVEEEPTEPPSPSTLERMAALCNELRRLSNADDDATILRTGIRALVEPFQNLMQMYDHETRASEDTITVLRKKEQEAAARSLVVTAFDNTLDIVSEGEVKSNVVSLNNAIGDFALDIMQGVFEVAPDKARVDEAKQSGRSALLTTSSYLLLDDDDNRGYLIEALVHKTVVERLHHLFFQGQVAVTNKSEATEKMFEAIVMEEGE